jgi:2-phospho-L-lactate/phosphoenolpyruvate guanylyltransferase
VNVAAVVPIKTLSDAKSRLAPVLDGHERRQLAMWLLSRVTRAIEESRATRWLAVVSPDAEALRWAHTQGFAAVRQRSGDLNAGVELGRQWACERGADALLVVLGDLPLVSPDDVRQIIALGSGTAEQYRRSGLPGAVVLGPDRGHTGTNALLVAPPIGLPFAFGSRSRERHEARARLRGMAVATFDAPGIAWDVDLPADLFELRARGLMRDAGLNLGEDAAQTRGDGRGA